MSILVAAVIAVASLGSGGEKASAPEPAVRAASEPTVRMSWSVPRRYEGSWRAWNGRTYKASYLRPDGWSVAIDLCDSTGGGSTIRRYGVQIAGPDAYRRGVVTPSCRLNFGDLPRPGVYDLDISLETADGAVTSTTRRIEPRDWLIVSLGDSMASGEGNPDRPGSYSFEIKSKRRVDWLWNADFKIKERRRVGWKDRRCHRSARGGHALYARDLESADPHTSVTFLSLACSGAKLTEGLLAPYAGIEPDAARGRVRDHRKLPPQVAALAAMVGQRPIDALLLTAGVNDLHFSDVVRGCATNFEPHGSGRDCVVDAVDGGLNVVDGRYDRLARALRDRLNVSEVYATDYPANPFDGGGCGLLGVPGFGIKVSEAQMMAYYGRKLNFEIRLAALRNGWNFLPGMTTGFDGHAYCDSPSNLVRLEGSLARQANVDGTAHPNRLGHRVLRRMFADGVVLGRSAYPRHRVTVTLEEVRVGRFQRENEAKGRLELFALSGPGRPRGFPITRSFSVPRLGEWIDLSDEVKPVVLEIFDAPQPPRRATGFELLARSHRNGGTSGATHTAAAGLDAGIHEIRDIRNRLAVRYRVDVRTVLAPPLRTKGPT